MANYYEYQPTKDLNRFLREYGKACLNNTVPTPPNGFINITWQTDEKGNLSAYVPETSGGLNFRGTWSSSTVYALNDVVNFSGSSYISLIVNNLNNQPDSSPSDWTLLAAGGGGVAPGTVNLLPFYTNTGTVGPTALSVANSTEFFNSLFFTNALNVPTQINSTSTYNAPSGVASNGSYHIGLYQELNTQGPGWAFGNDGGWTVGSEQLLHFNVAQRGIHQTHSFDMQKHAVGDTGGIYGYIKSDGGMFASSDEGVTAMTLELTENGGYFHGTVATTTGTGDRHPTLAFTTGNNWTTDGATLLNISKGTLSGNLNGAPFGFNWTTNSGAVGSGFQAHSVSGVTLPQSTAIGIVAIGAISIPVVAADSPVSTNVLVTLCEINSAFPLFTAGSVVTFAGYNYPEQSVITSVINHGDGTMTLTLPLRNQNPIGGVMFQGGIQGQYISFDANLAFSGMRSTHYAFGSLTGTDLICGSLINGGSQFCPPDVGNEAATNSGANSGFHLYPGAEIVKNADQGFNCTIEQNGVHWVNGDVVENPHFPWFGGTALWITKEQFSPTPHGPGSLGIVVSCQGYGFGGGNTVIASFENLNPGNYYLGNGGPIQAPTGLAVSGPNFNGIAVGRTPDDSNGAVLFVGSDGNTSVNQKHIISLNFIANGNLDFNISEQSWVMQLLNVGNTLNVGNQLIVRDTGSFVNNQIVLNGSNSEADIIFNGNPAAGASGIVQTIRTVAIGGTETSMNFETGFGGLFRFRVADSGGTQHNIASIDVSGLHVTNGASGTFTTVDSKTVTVSGGIITSIV